MNRPSKKQIVILAVVLICGGLATAFLIEPGLAYATRDLVVDQLWDPGTKAIGSGLSAMWASATWQTYIAPYDWAISGVLFFIVGLVVVPKAWLKLRGRKTATEVKTEKRSEPISAISYPTPSSTGVKQEPKEETVTEET